MSNVNWDLAVGTRAEDLDWGVADGDDMFSTRPDDLLIADPRDVRRAETAPMVLTIMGSGGSLSLGTMEEEKVDPGEEYRYTEEYHRLYYSKNPRDPRMLPPLTRRRHHLVRESRDTRGGEFSVVSSTDRNGAVGDRVPAAAPAAATTAISSSGSTRKATPAQEAAAAVAVSAAEEQAAAQALVKAYIDGFRAEWEYGRIKGYIRSFSKDQDGSRLVQRLLEKQENIVPIFDEVYPFFEELATDVFGNYVLQKLFDVVPRAEDDPAAPAEIRAARLLPRLTSSVRGRLVHLSCQTYGCRVMQKALENMREADRRVVVQELRDKVVDCVFDQNANHVVQKVVEVCPTDAQFVIDAFVPALGDLACHAYGCRVLQRTFEKCHDVAGVNIRPLLEAVLQRVNEFTIHQYGNYVVQHAILNAPDDLRHRFIMQLAPQLYALSCSKFASNVAERIVTSADEEERDEIIRQLKKPLSDAQRGNYLIQMMQDTYANYVVQRFFEAVSPPQRQRIGELVQPFVAAVNQSVYGRHLLRKMVANGILDNSFLLNHNIDVSSAEYGGSTNHHHNNNHGGGGRSERNGRHNGNGSRNGGAGFNNGARNGRGGMMNGHAAGAPNGAVSPAARGFTSLSVTGSNHNGGNNNNNMAPQMHMREMQPGQHMMGNGGVFVMQSDMSPAEQQQHQQHQQQQGGGAGNYVTAVSPQQFSFSPAFNMATPQPQQQQRQQQQQALMNGGDGQFVSQMPSNNGHLNFPVYSTQHNMMSQAPQQQSTYLATAPHAQQQQQQQQQYAMQNFGMQQQQQQQMFRQDNAWSAQQLMQGGCGDAPHHVNNGGFMNGGAGNMNGWRTSAVGQHS